MSDDSALTSDRATSPEQKPRRAFVARLAGSLAALPIITRQCFLARSARAASSAQPAQPNAGLLTALGSAVLPAELGAEGTARAVADFQRWMDAYRPGAESNHGYGTGNIQRLPADPRPRWRTQLTALDAEARRTRGQSFAALSRAHRAELVRAALTQERGESLPTPVSARHVALALLAHFYDSPAANDLCYEAQIGRQQCRPLTAAPEQPVPLTRRGT